MRNRKKKNKAFFHSLPARLDRKYTYIFPSRHGFLFLLVLGGMLIGSINYNNNLGFLLVFLLGSIAFVSIFHTSRNLDGIEIVSARATPVFSGETAIFEFKIAAPAPLRPSVSWKFSRRDPVDMDIAPQRENSLRIDLPTIKRGLIRPGILTVETHYPLGIFRSWSKLRPDAACVVYPKPVRARLEVSSLADGSENNGAKAVAGVDDFQGLRNYQPGDSLKHISWKAYSRGQGLFTKVFEGESGAGIYLDWESLREPDVEKKLSYLCYMVLEANRLDIDYGLNLPGKTVEPGKGESHKHKCLRALALFELRSQ